ncbi:uncharacterized protein C8R40DRAFT_1169717 [Lentinula edodes]|uniref:uncharacterized protein n=1 Tax=Lentinula edodes TaxID=5353 RepID=UPI001E8CD551|nr:uncharacterized protein C8R40DRAFT_1169717 [Lentinula edodes]KAH7876065.1 hypothetical protein C8R40DRAFT_1169717 [Lentinula edodes]
MSLTWKESDRIQIEESSAPNGVKSLISSISLSFDAHYLAIALGIQIQIWDLLDFGMQVPKANIEVNTTTNFMTWFPKSSRLVTAHDKGPVYVFTIEEHGVDVDCHRNVGVESAATSIAILDERTMAVALTLFVQLQRLTVAPGDSVESRWCTIGQLPPPARKSTVVQSVHTLTENKILVVYQNDYAVVWKISSDVVDSMILNAFTLPGLVNDVCSNGDRILCTDHASRTYRIFKIRAQVADLQAILPPRTRDASKASQLTSTAIFLPPHGTAVVGGGVGQMVLFDDQGNRLQNLSFEDENHRQLTAEQVDLAYAVPQSISCIYLTDTDTGVLAAAANHDKQGEVIIWRTVQSPKPEPKLRPLLERILTTKVAIGIGILMAILAYVITFRWTR